MTRFLPLISGAFIFLSPLVARADTSDVLLALAKNLGEVSGKVSETGETCTLSVAPGQDQYIATVKILERQPLSFSSDSLEYHSDLFGLRSAFLRQEGRNIGGQGGMYFAYNYTFSAYLNTTDSIDRVVYETTTQSLSGPETQILTCEIGR